MNLPKRYYQQPEIAALYQKAELFDGRMSALTAEQSRLEKEHDSARSERIDAEVKAEIEGQSADIAELYRREREIQIKINDGGGQKSILARALKKLRAKIIPAAESEAREKIRIDLDALWRQSQQEWLRHAVGVARGNSEGQVIYNEYEANGLQPPHPRFHWEGIHGAYVSSLVDTENPATTIGGALVEGRFVAFLKLAKELGYDVPDPQDPSLSRDGSTEFAQRENMAFLAGSVIERARATPVINAAMRIVRHGMAALNR